MVSQNAPRNATLTFVAGALISQQVLYPAVTTPIASVTPLAFLSELAPKLMKRLNRILRAFAPPLLSKPPTDSQSVDRFVKIIAAAGIFMMMPKSCAGKNQPVTNTKPVAMRWVRLMMMTLYQVTTKLLLLAVVERGRTA
jgi:quinol-cytochrome oxidoreductase complex cytochrome b subunit